MLAVLATTSPCGATTCDHKMVNVFGGVPRFILHSPATCTSIDGDTSKYKESRGRKTRTSLAAVPKSARSTGGKGLREARQGMTGCRGLSRFSFQREWTFPLDAAAEAQRPEPQAARPRGDFFLATLDPAGRCIRGLIGSRLPNHQLTQDVSRNRSARWPRNRRLA
jgi:hypothetical protein